MTKAEDRKVLVLGVDGMDPRLSRKFLAKGVMPNLQKLIDRGSCRDDLVLLGGHPTVTPPMWTTLACGCYANVHGITAFYRQSHDHPLDTIEYNMDSTNCQAEPMWNATAEAGKKTLVWHWPGSSWPPTSDSPNLMVVDGSSPGCVGMATSTLEVEFLMSAKDTYKEVAVIPAAATEAHAPCVVENMEVSENADGALGIEDWAAKYITRIVYKPSQMEGEGTEIGMDLQVSPIKEPKGWTAAPEGAKEVILLTAKGLLRWPGLILKNAEGKYDKVAFYKSKKDAEPFVVLEEGVMVKDVMMDSFKDDKKLPCNRNMKLLKIAEDGSEITIYVAAAMNTFDDTVWSPKSLYSEIRENFGPMKPNSYIGCQDPMLITDCMLDNWTVARDWQADCINYLIKKYDLDVVFSHFHNVDMQFHKFVKHLANGKEFNRLPQEQYDKFAEDVYKQTDGYIGRFLHLLDEGWTILLVSDHALISPKNDVPMLSENSGLTAGVMKELGYTVLKKDENGEEIGEIDWEKTRAVAVRECNIYINLKGREETGIVDPADKYELEEQIMTDLYGYRDKKTGHRVVSVALRNRDALLLGYGGPECGDICYWMAEGYNADHDDCLSTTLGEDDTSVSPIFVAAGDGIKRGFKTDRHIREVDVAPTVAALTGVRVTKNCEGAPAYQIFEGKQTIAVES